MDIITLALAKKYTNKRFEDSTAITSKVVDTLPIVGEENVIYFVVKQNPDSAEVSYNEYMYFNNTWELLGNKEQKITVNQEFPDSFVTDGSLKDLCESVDANAGESYLGGVELTDMPNGVYNAECSINVISSTLGGTVLYLELYSANTKPYKWFTIYREGFTTPEWQPTVLVEDLETIENNLTENYATKTYVTNSINAIPEPDLSNYYTKSESDTLITNVKNYAEELFETYNLNVNTALAALTTPEEIDEAELQALTDIDENVEPNLTSNIYDDMAQLTNPGGNINE